MMSRDSNPCLFLLFECINHAAAKLFSLQSFGAIITTGLKPLNVDKCCTFELQNS